MIKKILKLNIYIYFCLLLALPFETNAEEKFKFANIDLIIKKTNYGKEMLSKINEIDNSNVTILKSFENELKKTENELKLKKNIISDNEFDKEINKLKIKVNNYNKEKDIMVKNLKETKDKELNIFFEKINPIIQNYMKVNSIQIIFNSKNIIMGNKKSDLTEELIKEINSKL